MTPFYLAFNSVLYLLLSFWCLLKPTETANYLGYNFLNNSGKVEYLTVYVGLEMGISTFLALAVFYPSIKLSGLIFCVCIYVGAILTRTACSLYYGNISKITYMVGGLEYALGIWGFILLLSELKNIN
jgi:hypothetical protein